MTKNNYEKYKANPKACYDELARMVVSCHKTLEKEIKKRIENGESYEIVQVAMRTLEVYSQPVNWVKGFEEKLAKEKAELEEEQKRLQKKKAEEYKKTHATEIEKREAKKKAKETKEKEAMFERRAKRDKEIDSIPITQQWNRQCGYYHEYSDAETYQIVKRECGIKADMRFCSTHCQFCTNKPGSDRAYEVKNGWYF